MQLWADTTRYIVAAEGLAGSVTIDIHKNKEKNSCSPMIWQLWVKPEYRRQGLATRMLNRAESILKAIGHNKAYLVWDERDTPNHVIKWYERMGYTEMEFGDFDVLLCKELKGGEK